MQEPIRFPLRSLLPKLGRWCVTAALLALAGTAAAQLPITQPSLRSGGVADVAQRLRPGEFLWAPQVAPQGPLLLVVSLATQRAVLYRNGIPIGISTVSSGRPGYSTPTGVFTILERHADHRSNLYNNAPMPYMQRLTWGGVALHGGDLPGYPASHGCVRLPIEFARLLFGITHTGMTVVVTGQVVVPRIAPAEVLLGPKKSTSGSQQRSSWTPQASPSGPVSIVVSTADRRAVVLRNGRVIGTSPVEIDGRLERTSAFMLQAVGTEPRWLRITLPGQKSSDPQPAGELRGRVHVPEEFRRSVESVLQPGTTVVVTPDPLGTRERPEVTILEDDQPPRQPRR